MAHLHRELPDTLKEQSHQDLFNRYVSQYSTEKENSIAYKFDPAVDPLPQEEVEEEPQPLQEHKDRTVVFDLPTILSNYYVITEKADYGKIFKQQRLPSKYIYYIQAVYCLFGDKTVYSQHKLVDSIGYKTLMNVNNELLHKNHIVDDWLDPFELKNCVDTMYYTRHTQVDLRNPFHNDYLRYHPRASAPTGDEESGGQFVSQSKQNKPRNNNHHLRSGPKKVSKGPKLPLEEYDHFIPRMTPYCEEWNKAYKLGDELVQCTLNRTEYPYVYSLSSKDERVQEGEIAKIFTLEGRRYIRVILNKIHNDREAPVMIKCRPIVQLSDGDIVGWTPVKYDGMGR
jgi:hypothetical protein